MQSSIKHIYLEIGIENPPKKHERNQPVSISRKMKRRGISHEVAYRREICSFKLFNVLRIKLLLSCGNRLFWGCLAVWGWNGVNWWVILADKSMMELSIPLYDATKFIFFMQKKPKDSSKSTKDWLAKPLEQKRV